MPVRLVADWFTDSSTCFLLGAGCSISANKPSMQTLTTTIVPKLSPEVAQVFGDLRVEWGDPTIEDLVNCLLHMQTVAISRKSPVDGLPSNDEIEKAISEVQKLIIQEVGTDWTAAAAHSAFFLRLAAHRRRPPCDVFTLNYDTLIEASLEQLKEPYTDGFRGAENAFFDPALFDLLPEHGLLFRVYKLHGSVNWVREDEGTVRRRPANGIDGQDRVVVYPAEQKYVQTQYGVYETLLGRFRDRLRDRSPNNRLVVLGYSFRDEHINAAIEDAITSDGSTLTVCAFIGADQLDPDGQCNRLKAMAERCDHRFNAVVGDIAFIGSALEDQHWAEIRALNLWRFEDVANLIAGGQP